MKIVLDASVVIDFLRTGRDIVFADKNLLISVVTVAELFGGESAQARGKQRELLDKFLGGVQIMFPTLADAKLVGKLKYIYRLSLGDAFVAVLALESKSALATLDRKDFEKIKGLKFYS